MLSAFDCHFRSYMVESEADQVLVEKRIRNRSQ